MLIWVISLLLMLGLHLFVQRSKMGKAMRATAQDPEAARMMGVEVDRVIVIAFFLGSALAGAGGLIFGLYYNFTSFIIGFTAGCAPSPPPFWAVSAMSPARCWAASSSV